MRFNAKGKGPLELPRLTSIGPMSESSREIGELIFRGSNIEDFNNDEFQDNTINGRPVDVWILDTVSVIKRYNLETETSLGSHRSSYFTLTASNTDAEQKIIDEFRIGPEEKNEFGVDTGTDWVPIKSLEDNGLIARHISEHVTGGLSSNVGAGFRFAGTGGTDIEKNAPLVLFIEKNRIPARLVKVEYTTEFINENPALAGAADSGGRMLMAPTVTQDFNLGEFSSRYGVGPREKRVRELRQNGDLLQDIDNDANLVQWFKDPLSNFRSLEPEQEIFAYSREIDLDNSLFGVCFYTSQKRLERLYKKAIGDPENISLRNQVIAVHKEIADRMKANSERLVTCVVSGQIRTSHKRINRSKFELLYDGQRFTDNYNEAIPFTDPSEF